MAESTRAKKVSRRKAMAILGSGAAVGAVFESVEVQAISCSEPASAVVVKPPVHGPNPRPTKPPTSAPSPPVPENGVFLSFSCCEETKAAVLAGAATAGTVGRNHLAPITRQLTDFGSDGLEEYCVMIWGLNKTHRDEIVNTMRERTKVWYDKKSGGHENG